MILQAAAIGTDFIDIFMTIVIKNLLIKKNSFWKHFRLRTF